MRRAMSLLLIVLVLVGLSALSHRFIAHRLIANLVPASIVCTALVLAEVLVVKPAETALGGLILPFIFMAVLIVSLSTGMLMHLLKLSAYARQA